ncbi:MAG: hypothetical protein SFU86_15775 [Pirellulaceae bacterium]|nr:hypothetical protein [Pirellulaceae bacterium]
MRAFTIACLLVALPWQLSAAELVAPETIKATIDAVGGPEKLLKLFRVKERLAVSQDPDAKGSERTSVIEPPNHWWVGTRDRVPTDKEPARFLVWGWALGPLADPAAKLEQLPEIDIEGRPAYGMRVLSVEPPMDMYFDRESRRLTRIDWRKDQHIFSDWRELDGLAYPAKVVGFKPTGKQWYHTEILELQRLEELPAGLLR